MEGFSKRCFRRPKRRDSINCYSPIPLRDSSRKHLLNSGRTHAVYVLMTILHAKPLEKYTGAVIYSIHCVYTTGSRIN